MTPAGEPKDQKEGSEISGSVRKYWRSEYESTVSSLGMNPLEFEESSGNISADSISRLKELAKKIKASEKPKDKK